MLVNRRTHVVKPGHMDAIVEILKTGGSHIPSLPNFRVYEALMGECNRVVLELEFDDMAHYERFWADFAAAPKSAQVVEQFNQHREGTWTNEIWRLR